MPDGISDIRVSGRVTADDFHQFKPTLHTMLDSDEIRFVEVIGPDSRTPRNGRRADRYQLPSVTVSGLFPFRAITVFGSTGTYGSSSMPSTLPTVLTLARFSGAARSSASAS